MARLRYDHVAIVRPSGLSVASSSSVLSVEISRPVATSQSRIGSLARSHANTAPSALKSMGPAPVDLPLPRHPLSRPVMVYHNRAPVPPRASTSPHGLPPAHLGDITLA